MGMWEGVGGDVGVRRWGCGSGLVGISAETNSGFCYSNSGFLNDQILNNWSI